MPQEPRVGVGVLILRSGTEEVLVGERLGPHGTGTWALPGGHLECGHTRFMGSGLHESFEECARREVEEETGLELPHPSITFAHAVNSVFPSGAHYVTIFMQVTVGADAKPQNTEPHKCAGWHWVPWGQLEQRCSPLFLPLEKLIRSGAYSPAKGGSGSGSSQEGAALAGEQQQHNGCC